MRGCNVLMSLLDLPMKALAEVISFRLFGIFCFKKTSNHANNFMCHPPVGSWRTSAHNSARTSSTISLGGSRIACMKSHDTASRRKSRTTAWANSYSPSGSTYGPVLNLQVSVVTMNIAVCHVMSFLLSDCRKLKPKNQMTAIVSYLASAVDDHLANGEQILTIVSIVDQLIRRRTGQGFLWFVHSNTVSNTLY